MRKINKVNWEKFKDLASKLIKFKTEISRVPVRAESWEEVIYAVLLYMEHEAVWEPTSHAKGSDIEVNLNGDTLRISAKGGKVTAEDQKLIMSSYRLTRFRDLEEMLDFLDKNAKEIDLYLICAREERRKDIKYHVFKIDSHALVPDEMLKSSNWEEDGQAWNFPENIIKGIGARIVKKMSNQLWYTISLTYTPLNPLVEVCISKKDIGTALIDILKSLDK